MRRYPNPLSRKEQNRLNAKAQHLAKTRLSYEYPERYRELYLEAKAGLIQELKEETGVHIPGWCRKCGLRLDDYDRWEQDNQLCYSHREKGAEDGP